MTYAEYWQCSRCPNLYPARPSQLEKPGHNNTCHSCAAEMARFRRSARKAAGLPSESRYVYDKEQNKAKYQKLKSDPVKLAAVRAKQLEYRQSPIERQKEKCRSLTRHYVSTGAIQKLPCRDCSSPDVQAHHENYHDPMAVIWICLDCHRRLHMEARRGL